MPKRIASPPSAAVVGRNSHSDSSALGIRISIPERFESSMKSLILFESLNYLQAAGLRKFPGAARAENAINLLEPLVEEGQRRCRDERKCGGARAAARASAVFEEHKTVMRGLRKLFRLPAKREAVTATTEQRRGTEATSSRVHESSL